MNMYDEAYALAKAIKESNEMKRLKAASEKVGAVSYTHLKLPTICSV